MIALHIQRKTILTPALILLGCFANGQASIPSMKAPELVAKYRSAPKVMVVNFWSTWCKPCIEEIPHFLTAVSRFDSSQVGLLLVSQDTRQMYHSGDLEKFISRKGWQAELVWLNETNADYYCPLVDSSWSGVIPATLIINPANGYRRFFEDSLDAERLEAEIKKAMK